MTGTTKKRILITDRLAHESFLTLSQQPFFEVEKTSVPYLKPEDIDRADGLLIRSRTVIDESLLSRAKNLQVIVTATSGFDHIDLEAAKKWGVTVMFTPNGNVASTTELTWGLVLGCARKLPEAHRLTAGGRWEREHLVGAELADKTYGVVGLGRIGSRVAEIARAFGMNVIAFDPYADDSVFRETKAERVAYEELLKHADVLSFHVPRTSETYRMLNRSHFEYIHRGIILVNTSRGSVISEIDLVEALEEGWVSAFGGDVFEKEPLSQNSKLLQLKNAILTPHIGSVTKEAFAKTSEDAVMKLIRFFVDGSTSDTLPPKAPWYGAIPPWK